MIVLDLILRDTQREVCEVLLCWTTSSLATNFTVYAVLAKFHRHHEKLENFCKYNTPIITSSTVHTSSYSFAIFMVACSFYILLFIYDSYYRPFRFSLALLRNIYGYYRALMRRPKDSYCRNPVKCYIITGICLAVKDLKLFQSSPWWR